MANVPKQVEELQWKIWKKEDLVDWICIGKGEELWGNVFAKLSAKMIKW